MPPDEITPENQSLIQKKIAFAQNVDMVNACLAILRDGMRHEKLVGDTEFATLVNAITMDAQAQMMIDLIDMIEHIKNGGLTTVEL